MELGWVALPVAERGCIDGFIGAGALPVDCQWIGALGAVSLQWYIGRLTNETG